jgi:hypothetical protein
MNTEENITVVFDVFVIDGTIDDWLNDEASQKFFFSGMPADAAETICKLALEQGISCALQRRIVGNYRNDGATTALQRANLGG